MPLDDRTRSLMTHLLARTQREGRLPSVVAGVVRDGQLVWDGAAGSLDGRPGSPSPDADTQYRMGSITKTFVAVGIMRLRDAGRLRLEDRVEDHLPGTPIGAVSIEQLLTHTAGAPAETSMAWWERTPGGGWDELAETSLTQRFRAGRRFHYSNVGFGVLGEILARLDGRPWLEVVSDEILRPLGMTRTTPRPVAPFAPGLAVHPFADVTLPEPEEDGGAMGPAGQLWSTVTDLGVWAAFLGGDTGGVLSPDSLAEMCEPHQVDDLAGQPWQTAHGLGWQVWNVDGVRYAGHGGSMPGFLAGLRVRLDGGDGSVTLTNATSASGTALRDLSSGLLDILATEAPATPQPWYATGDPGLLDLVGTWHWGPSATTATVVGEHLLLGTPGTGRGSRFAPVGPDTWVGLDGYLTGEPLTVLRDEDGTPRALDVATFIFSRTPYDPLAPIPGGVDSAGWRGA